MDQVTYINNKNDSPWAFYSSHEEKNQENIPEIDK